MKDRFSIGEFVVDLGLFTPTEDSDSVKWGVKGVVVNTVYYAGAPVHKIKFEGLHFITERYDDDPELMLWEIYDSPLYKLVQNTEED